MHDPDGTQTSTYNGVKQDRFDRGEILAVDGGAEGVREGEGTTANSKASLRFAGAKRNFAAFVRPHDPGNFADTSFRTPIRRFTPAPNGLTM